MARALPVRRPNIPSPRPQLQIGEQPMHTGAGGTGSGRNVRRDTPRGRTLRLLPSRLKSFSVAHTKLRKLGNRHHYQITATELDRVESKLEKELKITMSILRGEQANGDDFEFDEV